MRPPREETTSRSDRSSIKPVERGATARAGTDRDRNDQRQRYSCDLGILSLKRKKREADFGLGGPSLQMISADIDYSCLYSDDLAGRPWWTQRPFRGHGLAACFLARFSLGDHQFVSLRLVSTMPNVPCRRRFLFGLYLSPDGARLLPAGLAKRDNAAASSKKVGKLVLARVPCSSNFVSSPWLHRLVA